MNIALITEKYPPDAGGLAVSTARFARLLAGDGRSVEVFAPSASLPAGHSATETEGGIAIHRFGIHRKPEEALADWCDLIVARAYQRRFDVLHGYFLSKAGFLAAYAGRRLRIPCVVSARGNDLDRAWFDPGKAAHILFALEAASAITVNSRDLLLKAEAAAGRRVHLIPNGVDPTVFVPADTPAQRTVPVIGFAGEARAKKGLAALLLAAREASTMMPLELRLAGPVREGEDAELLQVFQKQNPALPIRLLGNLPHAAMPDFYRSLDVAVFPSLRDGLPNALLEAMACGCAIVGTNAGGIPDAITDRVNGRLIPARNVEALSNAILQLLADAELRARFGANARETVLEQFTCEQELQLNLQLYASL